VEHVIIWKDFFLAGIRKFRVAVVGMKMNTSAHHPIDHMLFIIHRREE
jgi:hypothetical protein